MNILPIAINNTPASAKSASGDTPLTRNDPASQTGKATASTAQTGSAGNDPAAEPFASLLARQIGETAPPGSAQFPAAAGDSALNQNSTESPGSDAVSAAKKARDQTASGAGDPADSVAAMMMQIPLQQNAVPVPQSIAASDGNRTAAASPLSAADNTVPGASQLMAGNDGMEPDSATRQKPTYSAVAGSDQLSSVSGDITALPPTTDGSASAALNNSKPGTASPAVNNTDQPAAPAKSDNAALFSAADAVRNQATGADTPSQAIHSDAKPAGPEPVAGAMPDIQAGNMLAGNTQAGNTQANNAQAVTSPIGSSAWANEFSQKITWMSNQQSHSAELHLNPPDLGPLNVVLKMSDNQLTVQFTSPHSAVREAVENAMPKLREVLADNQITLGNTTVSDQPPRDRSGEGYQNRNPGSTAQRDISSVNTGSSPLSPATAQNVPARRHNGILDTFA